MVTHALDNDNTALDAIRVRFFGIFQIDSGGFVLTESASITSRPWGVFQFLLLNRHKNVSKQQLIDVLWGEDESAQPEKALKNLVYRLRILLSPLQKQFGQEIVLSSNGSYCLNTGLPWKLDFEEFEEMCSVSSNLALPFKERLRCCQRALALYRGEFLPDRIYDDWVLAHSTHFHTLYLACIQQAIPLFEQAGIPEAAERLCGNVLLTEKFEEPLHLSYLQLLTRQGKQNVAAAHYENVADLFFRELGVAPCEKMRALYKEISLTSARIQTDLAGIKDSISEKQTDIRSAFLCEYEIFRQIYRLEERLAQRGGQSVFLCLITLCGEEKQEPAAETVNSAMNSLLGAINDSLRRGDVVSRFSQTQYIMMLPTVTIENGNTVMCRICNAFQCHSSCEKMQIDTKILPLTPAL